MSAAATAEMIVPFEARGDLLKLPLYRNAELCVEGPAGTGKTRAILEYIHMLLRSYPGARYLVARKTNTALAASALVTFRKEVLQPWDGVRYFGGSKVEPAAFRYPNGAELIMTGLDKPEKVKSQQYDGAYINEATECLVDDVEMVRSRIGRNSKIPFWQLIMDVNPAGPNHWLKRRMDEGRTVRLITRHQDNPAFYDAQAGDWTEMGRNYIEHNLGGLTGHRYLRLVRGLWAAAEGAVYPEWDAARHVVARFPIPADWPRYMAIDWGYNNPAVIGWFAHDNSRDALYCYREVYATEMIVPDLARLALSLMGYRVANGGGLQRMRDDAEPLPRAIICDHDKGDRVTFERYTGLPTRAAIKDIATGIKCVKARLVDAGDGRPRLFFFADCLYKRDPRLSERKAPCSTLEEWDGYVWDQQHAAAQVKELPVDKDNHGMDMTRYACMYFERPARVQVGPKLF